MGTNRNLQRKVLQLLEVPSVCCHVLECEMPCLSFLDNFDALAL